MLPVPLTVQRDNMIYREKMKVDAIALYKVEGQERNQPQEQTKEQASYLDGAMERQELGMAGVGSSMKDTTTGSGAPLKDNLQEKEREAREDENLRVKSADDAEFKHSSQVEGFSANEVRASSVF